MSRLVAIALLALALSSATANAGDAPGAAREPGAAVPFLGGFLQQTRILYPLRVNGWSAQGEKRYDAQRDGVSVRYMLADADEQWIDVFFYPAGVIDTAQWKATATAEHAGIADARRKSGFEVDMGRLSGFRIGTRGSSVEGYASDLAFRKGGERFSSALVLAYDRLYTVKARLSAPSDVLSRRQARKALESFFRALWPELAITSHGHCWMPLPIEQLHAVPPAAGVVATQAQDGTVNAYLLRDRVLAANPQAPEAHAMMLLGMAMQGRMYDGCEPADSVVPAAAEGQREIRIEYWPEPAGGAENAPSAAGSA